MNEKSLKQEIFNNGFPYDPLFMEGQVLYLIS